MIHVGGILEIFENGDQQRRVVLPQKNAVHPRVFELFLQPLQRCGIRCQHRKRQIRPDALDFCGQIKRQVGFFLNQKEDQIDVFRIDDR